MRTIPSVLVVTLLLSLGLDALAAERGSGLLVSATDAKVHYVGRVDERDSRGPRMQWSNSAVVLRFRGTGVAVRMTDTGRNYYGVIVDGGEPTVIHPAEGESTIVLAADLSPGEHTVQLVRRTEASQGPVQFHDFSVSGDDATMLDPRPASRRIEVIGDSISCGYGNESENERVRFTPEDENGLATYGALAARELGAEYACIAWSGRKMWPDFTIPEVYDLILPTDPTSRWSFPEPSADAVVINLGTNDFGAPVNPDEEKWTAAYVAFVKRVRAAHPNAIVYLASGSMMSDNWPPERKTLSTLKRYLARIEQELRASGDEKVRVIHFAPQDGQADGLGGDWHPNLKTHRKMADHLKQALRTDLGWQ